MDQKTIETYNSMALEYDEETVDFWDVFPRTFLNAFIELNPKAKVLDVGAGPGRDGLILQQSGMQVTCLDASETMVKLSKGRGLKSMVGDFFDMPFDNASFDAAWAYTSLLHVSKAEVDKAMEEIVRVIQPNGYLGLGLIEGDLEGYRESSGVAKPRWFSFYKKEEVEDLLQRHGFEVMYFEQFSPRLKMYLNFIARKIPVGE